MLVSTLLVIATFFFMEGVAWFTHKYVMHGFLWVLHKDHHDKSSLPSWWEKNDAFFVIFAIPSMLLILSGSLYGVPYVFPIGLGILLYGICYFIVHDIFIHQRFKLLRNANSVYARAIRKGHKMHHKHIGKEDGECFGMLWVPLKYFKGELKKK